MAPRLLRAANGYTEEELRPGHGKYALVEVQRRRREREGEKQNGIRLESNDLNLVLRLEISSVGSVLQLFRAPPSPPRCGTFSVL